MNLKLYNRHGSLFSYLLLIDTTQDDYGNIIFLSNPLIRLHTQHFDEYIFIFYYF